MFIPCFCVVPSKVDYLYDYVTQTEINVTAVSPVMSNKKGS